jgi:photosystem II stability/assembly factor-like uncharacterized protein
MAAQEAVNDIMFCNEERCAGVCGGDLDLCEQGFLGCDSVTSAEADVVYTNDNGDTWANAAVQPFDTDEDIISVTCVRKDKDTTRWIVARGTAAANGEIAYSDDSGATWTTVDVESSGSNLFADDSGALFALDFRHIWIALTGGYISFSDDGGVSWTVQDAGVATTNDYHAIMLANKDIGYAVAESGVVVKTDDGGEQWATVTAISGTPDLYSLYVFDENNLMVGDANGVIWYSDDAGASWTSLFTASAGSGINDMHFANRFVGMAIDGDDLYRTRNGGADWETVTSLPAGTEYNAVYMCDSNQAFVVGENSSNEGVVYRVAGY